MAKEINRTENNKKETHLSLDKDVYVALKALTDGEGITPSQFVNFVLKNNKEIKQIMESIKHDTKGGVYAVPGHHKDMLRKNEENKDS